MYVSLNVTDHSKPTGWHEKQKLPDFGEDRYSGIYFLWLHNPCVTALPLHWKALVWHLDYCTEENPLVLQVLFLELNGYKPRDVIASLLCPTNLQIYMACEYYVLKNNDFLHEPIFR